MVLGGVIINQSNITQIISNTINIILNNLFSSIDNNIYSFLDNLIFIDENIINNSFFNNILNTNFSNNLIIISNSLLLGFVIYYSIKLILSHLFYIEIEKPNQFIFKLLIFAVCINSSYFICEQLLNINNLVSESIREVGKNIFDFDISFNTLILKLNSLINIESENFNIFSVDGIIKSFISIGLFNLLFSYSLRYIMIKVFVLVSPFSFLTLINHSTSWFFKSWFRNFIGLLLLQSLISIILLIVFSVDYNPSDLFSKLVYIGGIYALTRANIFIKDIIGGISTDVSIAFSNLNKQINT